MQTYSAFPFPFHVVENRVVHCFGTKNVEVGMIASSRAFYAAGAILGALTNKTFMIKPLISSFSRLA